jgi:hypothetical protein
LSALEEWISEDTEKYLNTRRLVLSWKDVASFVGSENPEGIIVLYIFKQNVLLLLLLIIMSMLQKKKIFSYLKTLFSSIYRNIFNQYS